MKEKARENVKFKKINWAVQAFNSPVLLSKGCIQESGKQRRTDNLTVHSGERQMNGH